MREPGGFSGPGRCLLACTATVDPSFGILLHSSSLVLVPLMLLLLLLRLLMMMMMTGDHNFTLPGRPPSSLTVCGAAAGGCVSAAGNLTTCRCWR